jgi:nucleotide-binding universal stress UspA family protein
MDNSPRNKVLLAVDGSDQALEAVRYAATMLSGDRTDIVLFNVGIGFPEVFWDMKKNPLYETKQPEVMEWLAEYQLGIGEFNEKAIRILLKAGFNTSSVSVKAQTRKIGIFKDILQESYNDYSAIFVGRTGMSRLKDLILRSMAYKLAENVKHIPTVIVAGQPSGKRVLVALDESIESMRGVSWVGSLIDPTGPEIHLCHCLHPTTTEDDDNHQQWLEYNENRFKPYMDEASQRLMDAGVDSKKIFRQFICVKGTGTQNIVEAAITKGYATIVVGRRSAVPMKQEVIHGRFSEHIIKALTNMAAWVVN